MKTITEIIKPITLLRGLHEDTKRPGVVRPRKRHYTGRIKFRLPGGGASDPMFTLTKGDKHAVAYSTKLHNTTSNQAGKFYENYTASLDANSPPPAVAFVQNSRDEVRLMGGDGSIVGALAAETGAKQQCYVAAFKGGQGSAAGGIGYDEHVAPTLSSADSGSNRTPALMHGMQVRRLTPKECERLQGFPDGWTDVPHRGKPAADGPRYKAIGNSWAVPCARWIGERIDAVSKLGIGEGA